MALKKSDLYSSLWRSCDELRGGMDAGQYKDYILTLLFMKYVTDKAKSDPDSLIVVPKGGSFDDMLAAKGHSEIGDRFNKIIRKLAEGDKLLNQGQTVEEVSRHLEITESTWHRWKNQYGGMKADDAKRLKDLEKENSRLKRIVADQALDIDMLKELNREKF